MGARVGTIGLGAHDCIFNRAEAAVAGLIDDHWDGGRYILNIASARRCGNKVVTAFACASGLAVIRQNRVDQAGLRGGGWIRTSRAERIAERQKGSISGCRIGRLIRYLSTR